MRIKSYYAGTIREAIDRARKELGPDAMIIASRKTAPEQQRLGEYEVVCGIANEPAPERPAARERERKPATSTKVRELPDLNALLSGAGFDADLMQEILAPVNQAVKKQRANPLTALNGELRRRLRTDASVGRAKCERKIVALVGPPGAGKTTTTVKLAIKYGLTARRPLHVISMDGYRIAGTDALRAYTGAMGVGFDALETAASLVQVLEQHQGSGLILIDTPGLGPDDMALSGPLASLFSRHQEIDTHLVMPAYMSPQDMTATFARFRPFLPEKLLFTGMDLAASTGAILGQALRTEKPVSFLSIGQQIPEDLQEADAEKLVARFLPSAAAKAASAVSAA